MNIHFFKSLPPITSSGCCMHPTVLLGTPVSALAAIGQLPEALGEAENLLADTGYFSEANVEKCTQASLVPFIPSSREKHNLPLTERFREDPEPPQNATAEQVMRHRLQAREGKAVYATRKSTVETVFGIIKHVLEFRQFLLRGLDSVQSECMP